MSDPYKTLGVSPDATDQEIKVAYKKLAKKYHPDANGNSPEAQERMQEINAAYDAIINRSANSSSYNPFEGNYSSSSNDEPLEYQAAANYINARRYVEALNALSNTANRTAKWYFLSAIAHQGIGNLMQARLDARTAASMDSGNMQYQQLVAFLESGRANYQTQQRQYKQPAGISSFCLSVVFANLFCWFCC